MGRSVRLGIEQSRFDKIFGKSSTGSIRGRYVINPRTGDIERLQDMDPADRNLYLSRKRKSHKTGIIADVEPFMTGDPRLGGVYLAGRKEMREHMKVNDLVEFEPTMPAKPKVDLDDGLDEAIARAIETDPLNMKPLSHVGDDPNEVLSVDDIEVSE